MQPSGGGGRESDCEERAALERSGRVRGAGGGDRIKAAWTGLVAHAQFFIWMAQLAQQLVDAVEGVGNVPITSDFPIPS
jgi:hypothetical protein